MNISSIESKCQLFIFMILGKLIYPVSVKWNGGEIFRTNFSNSFIESANKETLLITPVLWNFVLFIPHPFQIVINDSPFFSYRKYNNINNKNLLSTKEIRFNPVSEILYFDCTYQIWSQESFCTRIFSHTFEFFNFSRIQLVISSCRYLWYKIYF